MFSFKMDKDLINYEIKQRYFQGPKYFGECL